MDSIVTALHFDGTPSIALIGMSHSVHVPCESMWKQTWVDNDGRYLDFEATPIFITLSLCFRGSNIQ